MDVKNEGTGTAGTTDGQPQQTAQPTRPMSTAEAFAAAMTKREASEASSEASSGSDQGKPPQDEERPTEQDPEAQAGSEGEEPKTEEQKAEESLSPRMAKVRKLEARAAKAEARIKEAQDFYADYQTIKAEAKKDPIKVLAHFGLKPEDVFQTWLGMNPADLGLGGTKEQQPQRGESAETKALREEMAAFKRQQEDWQRQQREEKQRAQQEAYLRQIEAKARTTVDAEPDRYGYVRQLFGDEAGAAVREYIVRHFQATNQELTPKQAADAMEHEYEEFYGKLSAAKKPKQQEKPTMQQKPPAKTLSSALGGEGFTGESKPRKPNPISDAELFAQVYAKKN